MPDKHENYNRFMKWLCPGYSNEKGDLSDRWDSYKTTCFNCKRQVLRSKLHLKDKELQCKDYHTKGCHIDDEN